jgi:hypothetical protein
MNKRHRPRPGGIRHHRTNNHSGSFTHPSKEDRNEIRLKSRVYYQQQYDKYIANARDSLGIGDRVEAEGHFQHAEHYLRQLNERIRYDQEHQVTHRPHQQSDTKEGDTLLSHDGNEEIVEAVRGEQGSDDSLKAVQSEEKKVQRPRRAPPRTRRHDAAPSVVKPVESAIVEELLP